MLSSQEYLVPGLQLASLAWQNIVSSQCETEILWNVKIKLG